MRPQAPTVTGLILLAATLPAAPALAQSALDDSIAQRPRPDFSPDGIALNDLLDGAARLFDGQARSSPRDDAEGDVRLSPTLGSAFVTDDNVLRTASNPHADIASQVDIGLTAATLDASNGWSLSGSTDLLRYRQFSSQDTTQGRLAASAFLSPTEETRIEFGVAQKWLTQPIEDSGAGFLQTRPDRYQDVAGTLDARYSDADWQIIATEQVDFLRYDANPPVVVANELDHVEATATVRIARTLFDGTALFLQPDIDLRHYVRAIGLDGYRHDSSGGQLLAGLRYDVSSVTYLELGAGWLRQIYVDHAFAAVNGPGLQGLWVWNPLDELSVTAAVTRRVNESNLPDSSGVEASAGSIRADLEITDALLANCSFSYTDLHYKLESGAVPRTDDVTQYGVELRYLIDRGLSLDAAWSRYARISTFRGAELDFQRLSLALDMAW